MTSTAVGSRSGRLTRLEIAILLAAVLVCRVLATRACPIYDDAFITYRYARHFAAGLGLVFNPGEPWEPVLGTTTPAYALLLAGFAALGVELTRASLAVNALCDLVSALLILRALGMRRLAGTIAVLGLAAVPHLVRVSVGGMESPLFAALALASATSLAAGRPRRAGLFAALDCTVRPEGVLLVLVLAVELVRRPRDLVRMLVPVAVVGALATGALAWTYGDVVPQSVHAKSAMHSVQTFGEVLRRWASILMQSFAPSPPYLVLLPAVALGLAHVLRRGGAGRTFSLFALAITASYLAARPHVWGWYFYVPLVAWVLWLGDGGEQLCERFGAARVGAWSERGRARLRSLGVPAAVVTTIVAVAGATVLFASHVRALVYKPMHRWASETSTLHPNARILAADIGAIGYSWRGTVLDSEGLTWPQALEYALPNAMIEALWPEYLLIVAERPRMRHFHGRPEIARAYEPICRFSASGETDLAPDPEAVSPLWVQDYIVYKRRDF